jgi:hypothetical protein
MASAFANAASSISQRTAAHLIAPNAKMGNCATGRRAVSLFYILTKTESRSADASAKPDGGGCPAVHNCVQYVPSPRVVQGRCAMPTQVARLRCVSRTARTFANVYATLGILGQLAARSCAQLARRTVRCVA